MKIMTSTGLPATHWHQWFAWHPIWITGPRKGTAAIIWLETIQRRMIIQQDGTAEGTSHWEYRAEWQPED